MQAHNSSVVRLLDAILASLALVLLIMSVAGPRWAKLSPRTRRLGLSFCPILMVMVYGYWYSYNNSLPTTPALYLMGGALTILVVSVGYGLFSGK